MGYKHSYNIIEAYQQIRSAAGECSDPRNDGFVTWSIKQDLYHLKWFLDEKLKQCPDYGSLEADWLKEQEQKLILKYLKDDQYP